MYICELHIIIILLCTEWYIIMENVCTAQNIKLFLLKPDNKCEKHENVYVIRKAKTNLMALEIFDRPSPFNPLVHDDSLLHKFIILYLLCTMMQLPGNQVLSSFGQRWLRSNKLKTDH